MIRLMNQEWKQRESKIFQAKEVDREKQEVILKLKQKTGSKTAIVTKIVGGTSYLVVLFWYYVFKDCKRFEMIPKSENTALLIWLERSINAGTTVISLSALQ